MSLQNARMVVDRMNLREVLIAPHYAGLPTDLQQLLEADQGLEEAAALAHRKELLAAYGYSSSADDKPFAFSNGVAIIPVHGLLLNRFSYSWSFVTGYNFIRNQLAAAIADPDVETIVFDVNSNGGEAAGCFELTDEIAAAREKKKILAVVDSNCYSGAYAIASACTAIYVTPSGGAGSIGVYTLHFSVAGMLKQAGIEVTIVQAGEHKTDGNPYEKLPADVRKNIQANVENTREVFVAAVAKYREMDPQVIRDTEGRTYRADQALELGLIDAVQPPQRALEVFFESCEDDEAEEEAPPGADDEQPENVMTDVTKPGEAAPKAPENTQTQPAPAAAAPANAVNAEDVKKAERTRIQAITGCDEAKGREALAQHFALETDMSPEAAKKALAAAPKAQAATQEKNHFADAMNNGQQPNIEAGGGEGEPKPGGGDKVAAILAAQTAATGRNYTPAKK